MTMRRPLCLAAAIALSLGLAGCETSDMFDGVSDTVHNFNPFGNTKKKLAGERHPVFPEGVPGVQQGVPPELIVGAAPPEAAPPPAPAPKIAEQPKPKPHRTVRASPPPRATVVRSRPQPAAPVQAAAPASPPSRSAWESVPTTPQPQPARPVQQVRPAQMPASSPQASWPAPASQPVPTIWPDATTGGSAAR